MLDKASKPKTYSKIYMTKRPTMFRSVLFVVFAILVSAGCASKTVEEFQKSAANYTAPGEEYKVGVDDRLQISVWRNPDLSVTVPVRPDGMVSMPLVGDVQAGGRTPNQIAEAIRQKLSVYIRDPNVTVIPIELRSHEFLSRVRVTGAVRAARSIPYRQGMTVLDAVLEAGGLSDFAAPNRAKLYRKIENRTEILNIDLGDILNKGKLETNVMLIPGDIVTIPERLF